MFAEGIQEDDIDPEDLQPFPTLKRAFEAVDIHTGFNIEVKYPMKKVVGSFVLNFFIRRMYTYFKIKQHHRLRHLRQMGIVSGAELCCFHFLSFFSRGQLWNRFSSLGANSFL